MRLISYLATILLFTTAALELVSAAPLRQTACAVNFAKLNPATPMSIEEAKALTLSAWKTTTRFLRKNGIEDTQENQKQILNVFDQALSHVMTPLGGARKFRNESGFRVVDAPHLESLLGYRSP